MGSKPPFSSPTARRVLLAAERVGLALVVDGVRFDAGLESDLRKAIEDHARALVAERTATDADSPTPPCVVCGKPGTMGVGHVNRNDEVWYCDDHLDAGYERAAQP